MDRHSRNTLIIIITIIITITSVTLRARHMLSLIGSQYLYVCISLCERACMCACTCLYVCALVREAVRVFD